MNYFYRNLCNDLYNRTLWQKKDNGCSVCSLCNLLLLFGCLYTKVSQNTACNDQNTEFFLYFRRAFLTVMLFFARGIIAGVFQAAYVYTPEVYPTSLRAVGVGSCSAMARLGAMVTPYVAQVKISSVFCL